MHEQFLAKFANKNQSISDKRGLKANAKNSKGDDEDISAMFDQVAACQKKKKVPA